MMRWLMILGMAGGVAGVVFWKAGTHSKSRQRSNFSRGGSPSRSEVALFKEWLTMTGAKSLEDLTQNGAAPISADDAIIIVDMQKDFVLKSLDNPDGGRFGVPEGDAVVAPICSLIRAATTVGAKIVATRDYHPHNHCSFSHCGGPFPPHCVQGTVGSQFLPEIATALQSAMRESGPDNVHIVFKGIHEDVDSFGGLPYAEEPYGKGRVSKADRASNPSFAEFGACMGCSHSPWTGSLALQQSAVVVATGEGDVHHDHQDDPCWLDANAPPDVLAILQDGVDRKMTTLQDVLKNTKGRIIACGLALDFCVLDTCLNARALGFERVAMCVDAARAAHIHGVGQHGSGFVQDPQWVASRMKDKKVEIVSVGQLLPPGQSCMEPTVAGDSMLQFPKMLAPIGLRDAPRLKITLTLPADSKDTGSFSLALVGGLAPLANVPNFDNVGVLSPITRLPKNWPHAKASATHLCWAYPMGGLASGSVPREAWTAFLSITSSPDLRFAAHGGFLLLDKHRNVVQAQAVGDEHDEATALHFDGPRQWNKNFTPLLEKQRLQKTTLPELKSRGAERFCWLGPEEALVKGPETWVPSSTGAFLYMRANGEEPIYFPRERW